MLIGNIQKIKTIFLSVLLASCSQGLNPDDSNHPVDISPESSASASKSDLVALNDQNLIKVQSLRGASKDRYGFTFKNASVDGRSDRVRAALVDYTRKAVKILLNSTDSWEIYALEKVTGNIEESKLEGIGTLLEYDLGNQKPSIIDKKSIDNGKEYTDTKLGKEYTLDAYIYDFPNTINGDILTATIKVILFSPKKLLWYSASKFRREEYHLGGISIAVCSRSRSISKDIDKSKGYNFIHESYINSPKYWRLLEMFTYEDGVIFCLKQGDYRLYLKSKNSNNQDSNSAQVLLKNTWGISKPLDIAVDVTTGVIGGTLAIGVGVPLVVGTGVAATAIGLPAYGIYKGVKKIKSSLKSIKSKK